MSQISPSLPYSDVVYAFGKVLRARRKELGLSQETLALKAGIHRTYIADIERGEQNVALRNIARLADALELRLDQLFLRVENLRTPPV